MDAKKRLQELMDERGWTMYRLAKESGTSWSTIRNVFKRGTEPSVSTLEVLCKGLGVSLAQFFDTEHALGLTREQQAIWLIPKARNPSVSCSKPWQSADKRLSTTGALFGPFFSRPDAWNPCCARASAGL